MHGVPPYRVALLLILVLLTGCVAPRNTMSLQQVIKHETGRSGKEFPPYRCTAGAHRGASVTHRENTRDALKAAEEDSRYAFVEFDVQYTRDGKIVLFHDQRLLRVYGSFASVGKADYADLLKCSNGDMALFSEAMDVVHKKMNIEIKSQGDQQEDEQLADAIIAEVRARGRERDIMISSISSEAIRYIKTKYPGVPTGQIYWLTPSTYMHWDSFTEGLYERFAETHADYILLHVVNLRNIEDLLRLKPPGKTLIFWDFEDGIFLVHKDPSDRLWGTSALVNRWQQFLFR